MGLKFYIKNCTHPKNPHQNGICIRLMEINRDGSIDTHSGQIVVYPKKHKQADHESIADLLEALDDAKLIYEK